MATTFHDDRSHAGSRSMGSPRFSWVYARDSIATELLQGCPVVTAEGDKIGEVEGLLVDAKTHHVRYVMLSHEIGSASVAIPWQALYFDSALARLVFYTYS